MSRSQNAKGPVKQPPTKLIERESDELMEAVDGSDVDRVVGELLARGGADACLGVMLWRAVCDYYVEIDPESCV